MLFSTVFLTLSALAASARSLPRRADLEAASLQKRAFSGEATFYDVGLGSCGDYNVASDFIVALNAPQMGGGYPQGPCGSSVSITYNGKTANAIVKDTCPGCAFGDLDMSRSLFNFFASEDVGRFHMSWVFNDGSNQAQAAAPAPEPTTSTWVAPTSTWVAPTSTYVAPTTSSSAWVAPTQAATSQAAESAEQSSVIASSIAASSLSASQSASSAAAASSSGSSSSAAASPSTVSTSDGTQLVLENGNNIRMFNRAVANLGHLVLVGAGGSIA